MNVPRNRVFLAGAVYGLASLLALAGGCGAAAFDARSLGQFADQIGLGDGVSATANGVVAGEVVEGGDPSAATGAAKDTGSDPAASAQTEASAADTVAAGGETADAGAAPAGEAALPPAGGEVTGGDAPPAQADDPPPDAPGSEALSINGVYALGVEDCSPSVIESYVANPDVDGLSLRAGWSEVESVEGSFDWSVFGPALAQAESHGKKVMLRVLAGVNAPDWLYAAGAAQFTFVDDNPNHETYGQPVTMPVPWDPIFLAKWLDFVAAFGAEYAGNPNVTLVAVTGPAAGGEMHLGDKGNADAWHALGYTNGLMIETWELTIDAFVAAFPQQHLSVAMSNPVLFDNPAEIRAAVAAYCAQAGDGIQGNWLAAKTPPDNDLYQQVASMSAVVPVGFQMLCSAAQERFGGTLATAIDLALQANASFLEIYRGDIAAYPEDIAFAHEQLNPPALP
jgi:hypothetical protein